MWWVLLALVLAFAFAGCGGGDETKILKFTAIPDQNTTELRAKFDPIAEYLSEKLGVKVEYVPSVDYSASVEMFRNGDVHLAWFGGLTGVQARNFVDGARAIAQGVEDPEFYSHIIAHKDTGLTRSDEFPMAIKDLKFTFGPNSSTSGRLMPEFFIMQQSGGKTAQEFFSQTPGFSDGHDKTAEVVESGAYQAGVLNYTVYEKRVAEGTTDPEVCRILWTTPVYADYNFTAHPDIDKVFGVGTIDRLQKALIDMKDEKLLAAFPRKALMAATNEEFDGIRDVAIKLDMLEVNH
jgi:phosphonate transport system substrate-binding protein